MGKINSKDLVESLRKHRNQYATSSTPLEYSKGNFSSGYQEVRKRQTKYDVFLAKCSSNEGKESFSTLELLYYYKEVSTQSGFRYIINNYQKDLAILKKAGQELSNLEICQMIDFLFKSPQNYLNKFYMSPGILISGWGNKIYQDSVLWVNGEYVPQKKPTKKVEWGNNPTEEKSIINNWE